MLNWCRQHRGEVQMAATALAKLDRLRNRFAAVKPKPVAREDTFEGQFDGSAYPALAEIIAAAVENFDLEGLAGSDVLRHVPSYQTVQRDGLLRESLL